MSQSSMGAGSSSSSAASILLRAVRAASVVAAIAAGFWSAGAPAAEVRVAVASNFHDPARALAERFAAETGHQVVLSFGATGKHYAQIVHGAPFDIFLAADSARPARLERERAVVEDSRVTYARGRLALWSPEPERVDEAGAVLRRGRFRSLALANPRLAPYGAAAEQVLRVLDLWPAVSGRLVRGENIAQAYQFVASGNADLGFVAWSQLARGDEGARGSYWLVPESMHDPIEQQAVLLNDTSEARAFMDFLVSPTARALIRAHGYELPER